MANNRRRKTRKNNVIIETISNKNFIIISSLLLLVIILCIIINVILHINETKKIAEEQQRIAEYVEEVYMSVEAELNDFNNFKSDSIVRISAVGDILLGNNLKNYGANEQGLYGDLFSDITKYFSDSNIVIGTYETDITEETKPFANAIRENGMEIVTLAHNHAMDNGMEGLNSTKEYLNSIGIETIGTYADEAKDRVLIKEERGAKIAFLTYTYDNQKDGVNIYNEEIVKQDLQYAEENANYSIVLMHWGDIYSNNVNSTQKEQAKFLVDNGADLIIGAHPSAIQPMEIIKNSEEEDCLVAYSLGDFTSDFKSENANLELILNIALYYDAENNKMSLYKADYVPIFMNDYGSKYKQNRYKLLDMKNEIANYGKEGSNLDKKTYEKLVRGIDKLNSIIKK